MFVDWQLFRRQALGLSAVATLIVFAVWNISALGFLLYPFRLFVTFVHEAGHGLAALVTGGEFLRFEVASNGAGLATTRGGLRALIIPAGYLGAAFFGASLYYITNRVPYPRLIAVVLAVAIGLLSLGYGITSLIAFRVGLAFAGALLLMGLFGNKYVIVFVLNILAIATALNAVLDIFVLTRTPGVMAANGQVVNDAVAFSQVVVPGTNPALWAWLWALASIVMLGMAVYLSTLRPLITDSDIFPRRRLNLEDPAYEEEEYELSHE